MLRLSQASTYQQNAGTSIHKEVETFFTDGTRPTSAPALATLEHLPSPTAGFFAELELAEPSLYVDGVRVKGFIDLVGLVGETVEIYDLKTVSSWRYCKTEDDLRTDVQQGVYAKWAEARFPEATSVKVALVYVRRDNAKVRVVAAELTKDEIAATWAGVVETALLMKETAGKTLDQVEGANDVSPKGACSAFGGCPFFGVCWSLAARFDLYPEVELTPPA